MLLEFTTMRDTDAMHMIRSIYSEGCRENAQEPERHPEGTTLAAAIAEEEQGFLEFVRKFLSEERNRYYILEENGEWVSALRLTHIDDFYYLEALETAENHRKEGCAVRLMNEVATLLRTRGGVTIRSCVHKKNAPSLATHKKCGFIIAEENGTDYIDGSCSDRHYGMLYRE